MIIDRSARRIVCALALASTALAGLPAYAQDSTPPATTAAPAQENARTAWGIPVYDIPADPSVTYGVLENGMRYAVMKNETPQNTVALRLRFDVGSISEADSEQGLAHFLEHMAFNGSENVPEGEMIKLLEREGLAFGADTNASTGFDATMYKLDLPRNDEDLLDTGLMLLRETASNLTISQEAVDRERGIIMSEMRTRDSFSLRRFRDYFQFAAPETPFGERLPIGTTEVIENASADQIRSLYERYYRPRNAVLVVVGDIDPALVESEIREHFSDWQPSGDAGAPMDRGMVDLERPAVANTFVDPAVPYTISIDRFSEYERLAPTVANFRDSILQTLGTSIVSRRLQTLAQAPDSPILGGGAGVSDLLQAADQASLSLQAKEGEWEEALRTGEQELRRAMQYGFTRSELNEQLANFEQSFRRSAEQADTRRSASMAEAIANTAVEDDIYATPATQLAIFEQIMPTLTLDAVNAAFREAFDASEPVIFVTGKEPIQGGSDRILAVYNQSEQVAVAAPEDSGLAQFAYTDFGTPGTIVSDTTIEDLGIRTIRFANNVMLNLKQTDFEQGRLRYSIDIGRGQLALPMDEPGLNYFMNTMFAQGGLGQHSLDELQSLTAGQNVTAGLNAFLTSFGLSDATEMKDFERQMELATAYLTDPGYRPEMEARWQAVVPPFVAQLKSTPQAVAQAQIPRILAGDDPRFGIPDAEALLQRNPDELRSALSGALDGAPIEIAVVGDFDEDAVIADVAKTFGALGERRTQFEPPRSFPGVSFPQDRDPITLFHEGTPEQGLVMVNWPTTDDEDAQQETVMNMLAQVMRLDLLEVIREELGASYSPSAFSTMSDTFDDYGYVGVNVVVSPEDREAVFEAIDEIARELRDEPVDADLLQRARAPMLEQMAQSLRENGFWIAVADSAQSEADRLDRFRNREERLRSVTPEQIQAAAQRFLDPDGALRISIIHESLRPE